MTVPVRWGVLGAGPMAAGFVADLERVEGAVVAGVASRRAASARSFAAEHPGAVVHADAAALAAAVDVVYIATPNHTHATLALEVLDTGTPVLVEKPFALTAAEAEQVVALARARGVFCMEAMWTRFVPGVRRLVELVTAGAIGEVLEVRADFSTVARTRDGDRRFDPEQGGGVLLDLGVYVATLADLLLGPVTDVAAHVAVGPTGVDERFTALLRHAAGGSSVLSSNLVARGPSNGLVVGTEGTIELAAPVCAPQRLTLHGAAGRGGSLAAALTDTPLERGAAAVGRVADRLLPPRRLRVPLDGNGYTHEIREVHRCLRSDVVESPLHDLGTTVRVLDLLDRIRSADEPR